ncbi:MAG: MlaD family protein, partial [Nocardioides sp.]
MAPGWLEAALRPTTPDSPLGPATGPIARLGDRAYGVTFLLVVGLLIGFSVATYEKAFVPVVHVTLLTDRIGSQLQTASDVKLRGLIVGEVRSIETTGTGARLDLAIDPALAPLIPANVTAR